MTELTLPVAGTYVRLPDQKVYYVDCITNSGAHLIPLTGTPYVIRDRKKREKAVFKHSNRHIVVSSKSLVEVIDPGKLDTRLMKRRIQMAKREAEGQGAEQAQGEAQGKQPKQRVTQVYRLTNKAPKDSMKGQGKLVYDALKEMGGEATVGALTEAVKATGQLQTRQDAERVVGFYCSKFKRDGIVEAVKPAIEAEQAAAAAV